MLQNHECDNLTDIVRELTDSRGKLVSGKAIQVHLAFLFISFWLTSSS